MGVLLIKVPIRKKSGNLFNDPRIYILNIHDLSGDSLKVTFFKKAKPNLFEHS